MIYFYSKFNVFGYIKLCRKNQHFILKPFPQLVSCCLVIWQVCLLLVKAPCWLMGCHTPPAELSLFCGAESFPTGRVACRITREQWQESSNVLVYFCYFQGLTFRIWKVNATKLFTGLPAAWFVQGDACNSHGTDLQHWNLNRDYGKKWEEWNRHHLNEHKGNLKNGIVLIKLKKTIYFMLYIKI